MRTVMNRNFTLLVTGNVVSTLGSSVYLVVIVLYLKEVSESPVLLGLFNFLAFLPVVVLGPFLGALVDRWLRRAVIIWTDVARGAIMVALFAAGTVTAGLRPWMVLAAGFAIGLCNAFFHPAVKALLPEMVGGTQLRPANSIRSASMQLSNMSGNALGGVLFAVLGTPVILLLNGIAFLLSAAQEACIRVEERVRRPRPVRAVLGEVRVGFRRILADRGLRALVLANAGVLLLSPPVVLLLPFIVQDTLGLPAPFVGYYFATLLAGGLTGYTVGNVLPGDLATERRLLLASFVGLAGAFVLGGLLLATVPLFVAVFVAGMCIGLVNLVLNTTLQRVIPSEERGRVFALVESLSQMSLPLAYLGSGLLVELLLSRARVVFLVVAGVVVLLWLLAVSSRELRRLFEVSPAESSATGTSGSSGTKGS